FQYPLEGCKYLNEIIFSQKRAENYFSGTKQVSNWVMGALLGRLNAEGKTIEESPVSSSNLARLLKLIDQNVISGKIAKTVFEEMAETGKSPEEIIREKDLVQVTDVSAIEEMVVKLIKSCPKEVADYKAGKTKVLDFFVGRIMKETKGKANPEIVNRILKEKLDQA
ncbi:MAG: Asp-tRNA(Asn)/Glu-tRNA(Gln) amidotransferase GatCAB subunit B, partial [Proteobacteria bacterium]|nr:Asp-tRNA(Asn)/Glu-tRNA(Gln) amidotransferase GatCAB subunit B [Pseudomonadota bacterium]